MGRPAKPVELHKLQGTFRKDRHGTLAVAPPSLVGDPPAWMTNGVQLEAWAKFYDVLKRGRLISVVDHSALEVLAVTYSKWREASEKANFDFHTAGNGNAFATNPFIAIEQKYAKELRMLMHEFGMTPSARSGLTLQIPEDEEDEDLD